MIEADLRVAADGSLVASYALERRVELKPEQIPDHLKKAIVAIEDAGFEQGYSVILCNSDRRRDKELFYARLLAERQVDGILILGLGGQCSS